jgi:hypothetical protein
VLFATLKRGFEQDEADELLVGVELVPGDVVPLVGAVVGVGGVVDVGGVFVVVPLEPVEKEAPVRSMINVSIRDEHPKDVSEPSVPSQ